MNPTSLLRTRERDSQKLGPTERGVRQWTSAEIRSDVWFFVEGFVEPLDAEPVTRRYVTAAFDEALRLYRESGFSRATLLGYVYAPQFAVTGAFFERLSRVVRLGSPETLLIQFASGLMLVVADGTVQPHVRVSEGRQIFP